MVRNILPKKKSTDLVLKSEESFKYDGKREYPVFYNSEGRMVVPDKEYLHRLTKSLIHLVNNYDKINEVVEQTQYKDDYLKEMKLRYNEQQLVEIFGIKETKPVTPVIKPQHTFTPPPLPKQELTPEPSKWEQKKKTSDLYLVHNEKAGTVKIGRSISPKSRLSQLQCSIPDKLKLLFIIPDLGHAEKDLHKQFAHLNVGYEWFTYDQSIIDHFTLLNNKPV